MFFVLNGRLIVLPDEEPQLICEKEYISNAEIVTIKIHFFLLFKQYFKIVVFSTFKVKDKKIKK